MLLRILRFWEPFAIVLMYVGTIAVLALLG